MHFKSQILSCLSLVYREFYRPHKYKTLLCSPHIERNTSQYTPKDAVHLFWLIETVISACSDVQEEIHFDFQKHHEDFLKDRFINYSCFFFGSRGFDMNIRLQCGDDRRASVIYFWW